MHSFNTEESSQTSMKSRQFGERFLTRCFEVRIAYDLKWAKENLHIHNFFKCFMVKNLLSSEDGLIKLFTLFGC